MLSVNCIGAKLTNVASPNACQCSKHRVSQLSQSKDVKRQYLVKPKESKNKVYSSVLWVLDLMAVFNELRESHQSHLPQKYYYTCTSFKLKLVGSQIVCSPGISHNFVCPMSSWLKGATSSFVFFEKKKKKKKKNKKILKRHFQSVSIFTILSHPRSFLF